MGCDIAISVSERVQVGLIIGPGSLFMSDKASYVKRMLLIQNMNIYHTRYTLYTIPPYPICRTRGAPPAIDLSRAGAEPPFDDLHDTYHLDSVVIGGAGRALDSLGHRDSK